MSEHPAAIGASFWSVQAGKNSKIHVVYPNGFTFAGLFKIMF